MNAAALDPGAQWAVDANGAFRRDRALAYAWALAPFGLLLVFSFTLGQAGTVDAYALRGAYRHFARQHAPVFLAR